jgi:hypothetical protein
MLYFILKTLDPAVDKRVRKQLRKALNALLVSFRINVPGVEFDPSKAAQFISEARSINRLDAAFARPYEELKQLGASLGNQRICVLIDDLDRCSPSNLVATLEAINLILDVRGIVYVVALDYEVLVEAISLRYPHVHGHLFIEKLIQLPFRVPQAELPERSFMDSLIPYSTLSRVPGRFDIYGREIAIQALGSNSRQIKRFVNLFLLLRSIAKRRNISNDELLAAVLGLQLGWPAKYSKLTAALQLGDKGALGLLSSDDPRLAKYAQRFFSGANRAQLEQMFRLTLPPEENAFLRAAYTPPVRTAEDQVAAMEGWAALKRYMEPGEVFRFTQDQIMARSQSSAEAARTWDRLISEQSESEEGERPDTEQGERGEE